MTPDVECAVAELKASFRPSSVEVEEDGDGGAVVAVHGLELGSQYSPATSWCAFHITFQYPHADVYPLYFVPDLARTDGTPLGEGFSGPVDWRGRRAVQVSRRANRLNPAVDTAATKLHKVIEWVRSR